MKRGLTLGACARDLLTVLRDDPGLSAGEVAEETGRAHRRVGASLLWLLRQGLVERHWMPGWAYRLTERGAHELWRREKAGLAPGVTRTWRNRLPPVQRRRAR